MVEGHRHPLVKLKLGLQIGARLLLVNHLAHQSEDIGSSGYIIFATLFSGKCRDLLCVPLLPASTNCAKLLGQNSCGEPNQHVLTSLHPILTGMVTYPAPLEMLTRFASQKCWNFPPKKSKMKTFFKEK